MPRFKQSLVLCVVIRICIYIRSLKRTWGWIYFDIPQTVSHICNSNKVFTLPNVHHYMTAKIAHPAQGLRLGLDKNNSIVSNTCYKFHSKKRKKNLRRGVPSCAWPHRTPYPYRPAAKPTCVNSILPLFLPFAFDSFALFFRIKSRRWLSFPSPLHSSIIFLNASLHCNVW